MDLANRTMDMLASVAPIDCKHINDLLRELALNAETDALVRIWDLRDRVVNWKLSPDTWKAMMDLHARGKGKVPEGTIHPPADRRRLAPSRRLHKICKGGHGPP